MQTISTSNVSPLFADRNKRQVAERDRFMPEFEHYLDMPLSKAVVPNMDEFLAKLELDRDARNLWLGYPNLHQSVLKLTDWISPFWPVQEGGETPAVFRAVERAILDVRQGLQRSETDRRFVVKNFHNGLATLEASISAYTAWGVVGTKAVAQFVPFECKFHEWAADGKFERVIFTPRTGVQDAEQIGLVWKMRALIASNRDLGLVRKYAER